MLIQSGFCEYLPGSVRGHIFIFACKFIFMKIGRVRLRKEYRRKVWSFFITILLLCAIFLPYSNRALILNFFSSKCRNYQQVYSKKLNDRIVDYSDKAKAKGIEKCSDAVDLRNRVSARQLRKVSSGRYYRIENMTHSFPYLTSDSKRLLDEIGKRFRKKTEKEGFPGSRFVITSMTRTSENIAALGKANINASADSPHLYGNAFDISYARFLFRKYKVTDCDKWYMKEALAEIIYELKQENKCWATYERQQGCFHVVSR